MNVKKIGYAETGFFSKTVLDYLDGDAALRPFYSYEPDIRSVPEIVLNIQEKYPVNREALVKAITQQYEGLQAQDQVTANIERLGNSNTFTITTAHQLNIFTGPLYYIYKILNTIRLADDLNHQYPKYHFVPCYWMGSEDHDYEEINHLHLYNKKIHWDNFQGGSMGTYSTDGLVDLLPEIRQILREGDHLDRLMQLMEEAYSQPLLADSVRVMLNSLFGQYGLVVIDGNCQSLKSGFKKVILEELNEQSSSHIVAEQIRLLSEAGYKSKAGPREINLFLSRGRERKRIITAGEGFGLADDLQHITRVEMDSMVEDHPEYFSPNVILRPLHQQMTLPNIAYIGGGSEVAYWMQLKSLFDHHHVHFPMLLLRTSSQLIYAHQIKKLDKLKIEKQEIFLSPDALKKKFVADEHEDLDLKAEKQALKSIFDQLKAKAAKIDGSLDNWIGAEGQKSLKSLENISNRMIKAGKVRNEQSMLQIDKITDQIFPGGKLQERHENFMSFYSDKGNQWFEELLQTLDPFEKKFYLIY